MSNTTADMLRNIGPYIVHLVPEERRDSIREILNENIAELEAEVNKASGTADYQRYQTALAKGIPQLSKGIVNAITAMKSGDPFAIAGAYLDIGSTMTATIGTIIGTAGGPPGALIGALLSVFSMIIKLFSEKKPSKSIEAKLDEVIRKYDSENRIEKLKAAQTGIEAFVIYLNDKDTPTDQKFEDLLIKYPFKVWFDSILVTTEWLKESKNQQLPLWGVVLASQCFAYVYAIQALSMSTKIIGTNRGISDLTAYMHSYDHAQLKFLKDIKDVARNRGRLWALTRNVRFVHDLETRDAVVSSEGWTKFKKTGVDISIAVTNRQVVSAEIDQAALIALFTIEHQTPEFALTHAGTTFVTHPFRSNLKTGPHESKISARYGRSPLSVNAVQHPLIYPLDQGLMVIDSYDIWAVPGYFPGEVVLFTAANSVISYWKQGGVSHSDGEDSMLRSGGKITLPVGYKVGAVRAVIPVPFKDEDRSILYPEIKDNVTIKYPNIVNVVYGACEVKKGKSAIGSAARNNNSDHLEIYVYYKDEPLSLRLKNPEDRIDQGYIEAPWSNFVGIGVDSSYLWVYRAGAIACATHTEVKESIRKNSMPPWIEYKIPHDVSIGETYDPENPPYKLMRRGLIDLASCDDGTLTAIFATLKSFGKVTTGWIYNLTPQIDRQKRTLTMAKMKEDSNGHSKEYHGWDTDQNKTAYRVIKQPIYCWSLIKGIEEALEQKKKP